MGRARVALLPTPPIASGDLQYNPLVGIGANSAQVSLADEAARVVLAIEHDNYVTRIGLREVETTRRKRVLHVQNIKWLSKLYFNVGCRQWRLYNFFVPENSLEQPVVLTPLCGCRRPAHRLSTYWYFSFDLTNRQLQK